MRSGLSNYFKNIEVAFFDSCYIDEQGRCIADDSLKNKKMVLKIFCSEAVIKVEESKERLFYNQIKEKFSQWVIEEIESNRQTVCIASLAAFLYTLSKNATYPLSLLKEVFEEVKISNKADKLYDVQFRYDGQVYGLSNILFTSEEELYNAMLAKVDEVEAVNLYLLDYCECGRYGHRWRKNVAVNFQSHAPFDAEEYCSRCGKKRRSYN
jgi:hypothetical protein